MQWEHYERDIVIKYGVALIGWPLDNIVPLDNISSKNLRKVVDAIRSGVCKFEKLTEAEIDERRRLAEAAGLLIEQPRKTRSDKGIKRKKTSSPRSSFSDGEEDDNTEDYEDDNMDD